ncbi:hypothetical protein [Ramlibacter alkalitolerans]|uniref:Ribbon-helix-helix protein CopG domain-containing protein n=1 Tax=Ramlibacter alkalitolerans TaxID=2039631 RepID=A0ABS1JU75_9BURK|nr:hypothetical protein [Ramlibacter alkalitolerans]MBL0427777.1 hypothetical protein [Ramlibacter alkalitolerans]
MTDPTTESAGAEQAQAAGDDADKDATKRLRTVVSVTVSGDDYLWLKREAELRGVSNAKVLMEYAKEYTNLRQGILAATDGRYQGSSVHEDFVRLEARVSQTLQEMQEQIEVVGFLLNVVMAQSDALTKFLVANVPEVPETDRRRVAELAQTRYDALRKALVKGISDQGRSAVMERVVQDLDDRNSQ